MRPRLFPMVLGHEAAGVVESVGSGVTKFKPGMLTVAAAGKDRNYSVITMITVFAGDVFFPPR